MARVTVSVGRAEGSGPDVIGAVSALEVDTTGRIFVLDGQAQEVRVFGREGNHLKTFGRRGQGPGEFRGAAGLNLSPEGNLWVWDPGNARYSEFTPEGHLLRSVSRRVLGVVFPWRGELHGRSALIDWGLDFPQMNSSMDFGRLTVFYPIRVDLETGGVDTLPNLTFEASSDYEFRVPFRPGLNFHVSESGELWLGKTGEYTLYRRTLAGDTTLVLTRLEVVPMSVTPAERDSVLALPDPLGDQRGRLQADWIPQTKPVHSRIITDGAGHLLVFSRVAEHEAGTIVDVFRTETGEYLGQVDLPVRLETNPSPVAVPGVLVGLTKGALDIPVVVRMELRPAR
jgi:hypothetical protein